MCKEPQNVAKAAAFRSSEWASGRGTHALSSLAVLHGQSRAMQLGRPSPTPCRGVRRVDCVGEPTSLMVWIWAASPYQGAMSSAWPCRRQKHLQPQYNLSTFCYTRQPWQTSLSMRRECQHRRCKTCSRKWRSMTKSRNVSRQSCHYNHTRSWIDGHRKHKLISRAFL